MPGPPGPARPQKAHPICRPDCLQVPRKKTVPYARNLLETKGMGMWGEGCYLPGTESPREIAKNNENLQKRQRPLAPAEGTRVCGPPGLPKGSGCGFCDHGRRRGRGWGNTLSNINEFGNNRNDSGHTLGLRARAPACKLKYEPHIVSEYQLITNHFFTYCSTIFNHFLACCLFCNRPGLCGGRRC